MTRQHHIWANHLCCKCPWITIAWKGYIAEYFRYSSVAISVFYLHLSFEFDCLTVNVQVDLVRMTFELLSKRNFDLVMVIIIFNNIICRVSFFRFFIILNTEYVPFNLIVMLHTCGYVQCNSYVHMRVMYVLCMFTYFFNVNKLKKHSLVTSRESW